LLFLASSGKSMGGATAWWFGASMFPLLLVVAGIRLIQGQGRFVGAAVVLLTLADLVMFGLLTSVASLIFRLILTLLIANGVRGAFALSTGAFRSA
jgi:hypothetical protein